MLFVRRWYRAYVGLLWDLDGWVTRWRNRHGIRIEGTCNSCGECCRKLVLSWGGQTVHSHEMFEALVQADPQTYNRFVPLGKDEDGDLLFRCDKVAEDGRCTVYADRPAMCRRYPEPRMLLDGGRLPEGCSYQVVFPAAQLR